MGTFNNKIELDPNLPTGGWSYLSRPTAGEKVTFESAISIPAFAACVQVISESIGMIPIDLYRNTGSKIENANYYQEAKLLREDANDYTSGTQFRQIMTAAYLINGNAFAEKEYALDKKTVINLHYVNPDRCTNIWVDKKTHQIRYEIDKTDKGRDKIFHLPGLLYSQDGFKGESALVYGSEIISLALALMHHAASYFGNGALPTTIIKTTQELTTEQRTSLLAGWNLMHKGARKANKTAILPSVISDVQVIGNDAEKSQLIESRRQNVIDICRLFRMPPHIIQDLERATFSNIEEQAKEFIQNTLLSHITRWERELKKQLLKETDKPYCYYKFNVDSIARSKLLERYQAHNLAIQGGWKTRNEVREIEDLDRGPNELDEYVRIGNLVENTKKE